MKRRHFLKTVGVSAPATLAATSGSGRSESPPERVAEQPKEPRVFLFDDGRHIADLHGFEPPVTPADHAHSVDRLAGSGVDTLVYFTGSESGAAVYDSQV